MGNCHWKRKYLIFDGLSKFILFDCYLVALNYRLIKLERNRNLKDYLDFNPSFLWFLWIDRTNKDECMLIKCMTLRTWQNELFLVNIKNEKYTQWFLALEWFHWNKKSKKRRNEWSIKDIKDGSMFWCNNINKGQYSLFVVYVKIDMFNLFLFKFMGWLCWKTKDKRHTSEGVSKGYFGPYQELIRKLSFSWLHLD